MWIFWVIILTVIAAILMVYSWTCEDWQGVAGQYSIVFILLAVLIANINTSESKPTALDVYRGNTELQIISINGIPTDTIVIFKNE